MKKAKETMKKKFDKKRQNSQELKQETTCGWKEKTFS